MNTKQITATLLTAIFLISTMAVIAPTVNAVGPSELHVYAPITKLTTDGGHYLGSFSPDGSKIVYTGLGGIWVMNADGSNPHLIYPSGTRPDWGPPIEGYPDGLIALAGTGITIITPDGTLVKTIDTSHVYPPTGATITGTHSLDWSPDGTKIAFADTAGTMGIWTVNFDGTGLTKITDYSKTAYSPAWSPDGTEIACAWGPSTNMYVGVFKSDGTLTTPLRMIGVGGSSGGDYPDWGSNGKIVYSVGNAKLYVMNGDGSNNVKISDGPGVMVAWSPDCNSLVYMDGFTNKNVFTRSYPYATIQSAVDAANPGDTVLVHPGTYVESVYVWKPVTISSTDGPETTVLDASGAGWGSNGFTVIASDVTIEGFTIYGPKVFNSAPFMIGGLFPGDLRHLGVEHVTVRNNIIQGKDSGHPTWTAVYIWKSSHNLIENNTIIGTVWRAIQIYDGSTDAEIAYIAGTSRLPGSYDTYCQFVHPCSRVLTDHMYYQTWDGVQLNPANGELVSPSQYNRIVDNEIAYGSFGGIFVGAWPPGGGSWTDNTGTEITGNYIHDDSDIAIGTAFSSGSKVFSENTIESCRIGICIFGDGATGVEAHRNNIVGNTEFGVLNEVPETTVDATSNWWGDPSGPRHATNLGGSGDAVSDNVTFYPWLFDSYPPPPPTWPPEPYVPPVNQTEVGGNVENILSTLGDVVIAGENATVAGEELDYNHDGMVNIADAWDQLVDAGLLRPPSFTFDPEAASAFLRMLQSIYGETLENFPSLEGRVWLLYMLGYLPYQ